MVIIMSKTYVEPNLKTLVIHITYRCNGACDNCSNLCYQARSNEDMSVERIMKIFSESIELDYKWNKIVLQGGECTLHPDFDIICDMLLTYKIYNNPTCVIAICTNGYATKTKKAVEYWGQKGFLIENSYKSDNIMNKIDKYDYIPVNVAPIDIGYNLSKLGCFQSSDCGLTVNNHGYWECSPAAAACRVFDFFKPIGVSLKDVTTENIQNCFDNHCKYCGFMLPFRVKDQTTSKTWEKYLEKYNNAKQI